MKEHKKLKVSVKGNIRDLLAFKNLTKQRKKRINKASNKPLTSDPVNELARKLHPKTQYLVIKEIKEETKSSKTFRLVPDTNSNTKELAFFRAGQYLSLRVQINGISITRPYSISSSPTEALEGFYEITIRKEENGFLTNHIWNNWKMGTRIESSGPEGFFYYEPIRDFKQVVGIAGGSGITPFRSIAKDIVDGNLDAKMILIYGSSEEDDIIFYDEFKKLESEYPEKIKVIFVLSCEEITLEGCEQGFITKEIIEKYVDVNKCTFFISGPQVMYKFIDKEINKFDLPPKRIHREILGEIKDIANYSGFPHDIAEKTFKIKVKIGNLTKEISAMATESILVALERAKLAPPSKCRSGQCGFCRSVLISGDIYVNPLSNGERAADKIFNYFRPCSSYPITDLVIEVPKSL